MLLLIEDSRSCAGERLYITGYGPARGNLPPSRVYQRYKVLLTAILGITQSSGICYVVCSEKSLLTQDLGQRLHERFCTPNVTVLLRFCTFSVISCHPVQNECPDPIFACGHDILRHSVVTDIDIDALLLDLLRFFLKKPSSKRASSL